MGWFKKKELKIQVKKLKGNATVPTRAHVTDACFDMKAAWRSEKEKYIEYGKTSKNI